MPRHPEKPNTWLKPTTEDDLREMRALIDSRPSEEPMACFIGDDEIRLAFPAVYKPARPVEAVVAAWYSEYGVSAK